ncbi:MAPEG family protein [Pseudanabaena sp. UWO311]|uniref:MAPEG family protein n=1 Tax=Pseudanabaena sp. UWO311 TaxID=2487337 RepID=UPI0011572F73|nr:MAPEG family protein [Pseudanabaena sp. UWO311]TYQ27771.1 MAPEG family protein [Pseudanabaena sp. UWO311]
MNSDLTSLTILALWGIALNHTPAIARVLRSNVAWGMGNRETSPDVPAWVERADRAQRNHHDNLAAIAIVILSAQVMGKTDAITGIAAIVIVTSRILHSLTYIFGIVGLRSLAYFVALGALLVIVWRSFI